MIDRPHFVAFISHRSVDKSFVFWLHKKLEHYHVGGSLRRKYALRAKTVSPLCLDAYEFASNELKNEVASKLDDSGKMILICSLASASPVPGRLDWSADPSAVKDWSADPYATGWVGYEIDYMLKQGRSKDIIPVVIDGDPEKGDCFHPLVKELLKNDLLYFDFREINSARTLKKKRGEQQKNSRRILFLKLVAAVLGIKNFGEIYDHDAASKRARAAGFTALAAAAAAASLWAWSYFLPHAQNYSDYVMVNGLPEGIGRLSASSLSTVAEHYSITTTKASRRIVLAHVNSADTPIEESSAAKIDAPMIAVYRCRSNWTPDTVEYRDRNGIVLMTYAYATDMRYVTFQENEYTSDQVYPSTEADEYGVPVRLKIDRYDLSYDEAGRLIRRMYMSGVNYVIDDSGSAGEQFGYDDKGRIVSLRYLDRFLAVAANRNGVAGYDYRYDENGRLAEAVTVGASGSPVYGTEWYSIVRYTYSGMGQIVESTFYTPDGGETVCRGGYSRSVREYDPNGNKISERFFGPGGEALYCPEKYHLARYGYNERGDMLSAAYFDENGDPVLHAAGYSSVAWERDRNGNATKTSYFGTGGDPMPSADYAAVIVRSFNGAGYVTEERSYGVNGAPIVNADRYFRRSVEFDDKGRPVDIRVFGLEDNPVYCAEGWHRMHFDYDDRGNLGVITLYGTSDQLLPFAGYWAVQRRSYNGGGQVTSVAFSDQFGKPVVASGLYARVENTYDDRGLLTSTTYYDAGGKLTTGYVYIQAGVNVGNRSYARVEYEYDEAGYEIRRIYYDENGELTEDITPILEYERDEVGRVLRCRFIERDGELSDLYHAFTDFSYNEYGKTVSVSHYDKDGRPMIGSSGYATYISLQDFRGNLIETQELDAKGKRIGYRILYDYDSRGLQTGARYVDDDGRLIMNDRGYSRLELEYDAAGNRTAMTAYDTEGRRADRAEGYCSVLYDYDAGGRRTGERYYGADGESVDLSVGYHGYHITFNDYGNPTEIRFFDRDGVTLFRYVCAYRDYLWRTDEALYGRNGEPIEARGYGIWRVTSDYDDNYQKTSSFYYGTDGELHLLLNMYAGWSSEYENGLEVSRSYYGADGKPIMTDAHFASVTMERNALGQEVRRSYFDAQGAPVNNRYGFSVMEVSYGEDGEISSSSFRDTAGRPVSPDGRASLESMFLYDSAEEKEVYNPNTGRMEKTYFSVGSYNVRLLVFRADDGSCDQFAQPLYQLFNASDIDDYLLESALSYIPQISEEDESIDIGGGENAEGWRLTIDSYVRALEEGDGRLLVSLMDLSSAAGAAERLGAIVNTPRSGEEIIAFYSSFWQNALDETYGELSGKYGEDFRINYEFLGVRELDDETVAAVNEQLKAYTSTAAEYLGGVYLTVRYTVVGAKGSGMETQGFLTPSLVLLQTRDGWTLGSGNGFPSPGSDELLAFMGGLKAR